MLCNRIFNLNNLFKARGFRVVSSKPSKVYQDTEQECSAIDLIISYTEGTNLLQNTLAQIVSMSGYTPFEDIYGFIKQDDGAYALYYNVFA